MAEHPNAVLMRKAFAAATGDGNSVDAFWKCQHKDVEARVAGDGILSGTFRGKGDEDWIPCTTIANLARFRQNPDDRCEPAVTLLSVMADNDHAVALYTVRTTNGDEMGTIVGRIRGDRMERVWHFDPIIEQGIDVLGGNKGDPDPPPPKPKQFATPT